MIAGHKSISVVKSAADTTAISQRQTILKPPYTTLVTDKSINAIIERGGRYIRDLPRCVIRFSESSPPLNFSKHLREIKRLPVGAE